MMLRIFLLIGMCIVSCSLFAADNPGSDLDGIVLACLRKPYPMVYVVANSVESRKATQVFNKHFEDEEYDCDSPEKTHWYCTKGKAKRVFQGLNGKGNKMNTLMVCEDKPELPSQKFYSGEYLDGFDCLTVYTE